MAGNFGGAPVPFTGQVYQPDNSIPQLILQAGAQRAALEQNLYQGLGNTVSSLGQIPAQQAELQQKRAMMQLEQARAQREATMADLQVKGFEYANQQRQIASDAIRNNPNYDPDAITKYITENGGDTDTIQKTLGDISKIRDSKVAAVNAQKDYFGNVAMGLLPHVGTPLEGPMFQGAMGDLRHGEDIGIVPKGTTDSIMAQYKQDPSALPQILHSAIINSPAAMKAYMEGPGKVTVVKPGETATVGLGFGGAGGAGGQGSFTAPPEAGTLQARLLSMFGPQPKGGYSAAQQTAAEQAEASAKTNPAEWARLNFEENKYKSELAGGPESERAAKEYDKNVKDLQTNIKPWMDTAANVSNIRADLARAANGDKTAAQNALIGLTGLAAPAGGKPRLNLQLIHGEIGEQQFTDKLQNLLNTFKTDKRAILDTEQLKDLNAAVDQYDAKSSQMLEHYRNARGALSSAGVNDQRKIMDDFANKQLDVAKGAAGPKQPAKMPDAIAAIIAKGKAANPDEVKQVLAWRTANPT